MNKEGYLGNNKLSKKDTKHAYTVEQLEELQKCKEDIHYFAEKYFTIVTIDHGKIKIPLVDYQKKLLTQLEDNRFNIIVQSRQSYKCCNYFTRINIRNKQTNEIVSISMGELYELEAKKRNQINNKQK